MANLDRVNPKLVEVIREAARQFPGYDVTFKSGFRPGDKRQHGKGKAVDVTLIDKKTGKAVPDYQNAKAFGLYEKFAQTVRSVQQKIAPELTPDLRWGGYFSGKPGKYGALDLMHFDLAGKIGMKGGSWEKGLTDTQKSYFPGVESKGMGGFGALLDRPSLPNAGPIPQSRPSAPLTPFAPAPVGNVERMKLPDIPRQPTLTAMAGDARQVASGQRLSPPSARPAPADISTWATNPVTSLGLSIGEKLGYGTPRAAPAVDPAKQIAAYQQYGASRAAAPAVPTAPVDSKIANAYAQYAQSRMAAPTTPLPSLQMPPAPVMPTPPAVRLQPVPAPVMAPVQESYPAAPQRPSLSATDVWNGSPGTAMSTGGNQVSGDQFGNTSVTNQFGATTINNARGNQAAGSLIDGPLGGPMSATHGISLPSIPGSKVGQFAKSGLGTVGGAAIGSLGGPVGSILGALIGRELAKPGAGAIGGFLNGNKNVNTSQIGSVLGMNFGPTTAFAKPQSGLAFPDAPTGGFRDSRFSNRSHEGMKSISPGAANAISKGLGGLY